MSATTTANPQTYNLRAVLADYDLHHSAEGIQDSSLNSHPSPRGATSNPAEWPSDHRRVPAYRPVNTELDQSQRRVYQNGVERAFIGVMFSGVFLEAVSNTTLGSRVNTK